MNYINNLKINKNYLSIRGIEKKLKMPDSTLIKAVNGVQKLPEKWKQPLDDFIRVLAKNLIMEQATEPQLKNGKLHIPHVSSRASVISDSVKALREDEPNFIFKDCPNCNGKGHKNSEWCELCGGPGQVVDEDKTHETKMRIISEVFKKHGY
jgi:hypothetical protein